MSASNFCCTHQQQRIDTPEPPARPFASIDGIFAAAALPEDHPHALKFPDRKPELDASIVKSPALTSKLKLQFRRKSMKNLSKEKEYDEDAHQMTSQEVLQDIDGSKVTGQTAACATHTHRFGSVVELDKATSLSPSPIPPQPRTSGLRSLDHANPVLQRYSESATSGEACNVVDVAIRVAAHRLNDSSNENERPLPVLPKSFSSPALLNDEPKAPLRLQRSRSDQCLRQFQISAKFRNTIEPSGQLPVLIDEDFMATPGPDELEVPTLHVQEPTSTNSSRPLSDDDAIESKQDYEALAMKSSVRLQGMNISQQLRCMSSLSDVVEDDIKTPSLWNFHVRERSDFGANSGRGRHSRLRSSSGINSTMVPPAWGRVKTPCGDGTASIYSRPTSAGANTATECDYAALDNPSNDSQTDLNDLFSDWPLKPSPSAEETQQALKAVSEKSAGSEHRNMALPPTPEATCPKSSVEPTSAATNNNDSASGKWLSPLQRAPSKSSSSVLTNSSKQSRFFERFSPPKKLVRKRRSIFRFLRPGSRKQEARSMSSPAMCVKSPKLNGAFDGPSDDPALLTVEYELSDRPRHSTKSISMSNLGQRRQTVAAEELLAPQTLQRRPTLADYERNLSVIGDDRRRPSAVNLQRIKEIQEDDRRESVGIRRRVSRARALKDDASPLMAQALEKHQQEKALFRSASKQRESLESSYPITVFRSSSFTRGDIDPSFTISDDHSGVVDPSRKGNFTGSSGQRFSASHLAPPDPSTATSSRRQSVSGASKAASTAAAQTYQTLAATAPNRSRIGTSLDAWSRYPSHTRLERCGPAGRADAVFTRDFAVDINPEDIHDGDEADAASPNSNISAKITTKQPKPNLPKTRSTTFSNILRYYSDLFSGASGQNRRTSITTAGRLEYPELEILPPQLPTELSSQHRHPHPYHLDRLVEHMRVDADKVKEFVKEEENKLEGYMREEEGKLEHFVKNEEHRIQDFVKKEEAKLKTYVRDEEDKLVHHHGSSDHESTGNDSLFPNISVFGTSHKLAPETSKRRDTLIGPNDDTVPGVAYAQRGENVDCQLRLDGAVEDHAERRLETTSKADVWSGVYKACLAKQSRLDLKKNHGTAADLCERAEDAKSMPPPNLKPTKPRSPQHPTQLDRNATIRRFPSVTVIDDRKGHFRSISLLSVKTSRSAGFERSSTHDLLELVQARERQEREKLLKIGPNGSELHLHNDF